MKAPWKWFRTELPPVTDAASAERRAMVAIIRMDVRFLILWLLVATIATFFGNIGDAVLELVKDANPDTLKLAKFILTIIWSAVPPTLLMMAIHALPVSRRLLKHLRDEDLDNAPTDRHTVMRNIVVGVVIGALGWSSSHIIRFGILLGTPVLLSWLPPFVIDLSVAGATLALVKALPITARLNEHVARWSMDPLSPASPQVEMPVAHHEMVHGPTGDAPVVHQELVHDALRGAPVTHHEPRHDVIREPAVVHHEPVHEPHHEPPVARPVARQEALTLHHSPAAMAQMIMENSTIKQPIETVEKVLELAMAGSSRRDIAEAVSTKKAPVSPSTIGRIIAAARELDTPQTHPRLVTVS